MIDNQEQVDYFEAALRLLKAYGSKGVVFWAYNPELPEGGHEVNGEIRGRATEKLMSVWFR